ncbi:vacuolar protein sorting-associated protein 35 [Kipferlia bialata]|uniref:Vacuolar protein sorting-associated protein 35 n=1 Tax=Kipferlia bialata TaxID=797122 RepID=A0A391NTM7_9EUKA|nr:vacuolar protein sorting-associated protein 35 [Kipferlia bialata]|eukprot:g587.t1
MLATQQSDITNQDDQDSWLEDCLRAVDAANHHLEQCAAQSDFKGVITHACVLLTQLRTNLLQPRTYASLFARAHPSQHDVA